MSLCQAREEKSKDNKKIIVSRDKAKKVEKASRQPQQKKMSLQRPYPTKKRKQSLMMTMIQPRQRPSAIRFKSFIVSVSFFVLFSNSVMWVECGLPPEYCEWSGREFDLDDCKKWLAEAHPDLFESIYPPADDEEESKQPQKKKKKAKKVGFAAD